MITTAPKGTKDILPGETAGWQYVEGIIRQVCAAFGYDEVRVPTFEHTELFLRGVGETTDIVQKEMYTFEDKGGRSITLKPEGTAGVARAFVEHALYNNPLPQRVYYVYSPVFRYERPQAGRLREHHQFGIEVFGASLPSADAEVILLGYTVLQRLGLGQVALNLNTIGCPKCRPQYLDVLKAYLAEHAGELCPTCRERTGRNPLRVLDCKVAGCRPIVENAPRITEHICGECSEHFSTLRALLDAQDVPYVLNPLLVRGLDYYTRTVFEFVSGNLGAQGTVCGGGRYDGLIAEVGGPQTPGAGFGMGMERLVMEMQAVGAQLPQAPAPLLYVAPLGGAAYAQAFNLTMGLRRGGINAQTDCAGRSLKAQMKYANKLGCRYVAVVGDEELAEGRWRVKNMATGEDALMTPQALMELCAKEGRA